MLSHPAPDRQPVGEGTLQHLADEQSPEGRELRLLVAGADEDVQRLTVAFAAKVIAAGGLDSRLDHRLRGQRRLVDPEPADP